MKKLMISTILIAFIMLGSMSAAKATTVTFYVRITITDNCLPSGYNGNYCVRLNLLYKGTVACSSQLCNISGSGCYAFTCELDPVAEDNGYSVALVTAARYPSGFCASTNGSGSSGHTWSEMITNTCVATLSVTL
jgi:hypothetical protein